MIVENIIPRNVIINLGAAEVDNYISTDDIFDFHTIRECNIYFIISHSSGLYFRLAPSQECYDVTSKAGDQIKLMKRDHSFLFICVSIKIGKK